ncbi:MAG: alkaline phosphatase family protein [Rhodothermales bacterium]|nr:alkaline phosphatase family protein [Rhodothermales bacterium]
MTTPAYILFIFVDGIGLGPANASTNPFAARTYHGMEALAGGQPLTMEAGSISELNHVFHGIDATLGMDGLPQSGTGQATLFTGRNAAQLAGQHYGPYPPIATHASIAEANLFRQLSTQRALPIDRLAFANAYPPPFFSYAESRNRWTVTTRCCRDAGVRIRTMDDLRAGEALSAELTNRSLVEKLGIDCPIVSEEEAARRLVDLAQRHVFTLFEYYLTDKAGHAQDTARAEDVVRSLDRFVGTLLETVDLTRTLLILTSDHGNLEDLGTRGHTRNPVPFVALGAGASAMASVRSLMDVVPALLAIPTKAVGAAHAPAGASS